MIQHQLASLRMSKFIPEKFHSDIRIVMILREPISRDLSWYNHQLAEPKLVQGSLPEYPAYVKAEMEKWEACKTEKDGNRILAANECHDTDGNPKSSLQWGMYSVQIDRALRNWPRKQMFIMNMDHMLDNTHMYMKGMFKFMGLSEGAAFSSIPSDNTHDSPNKVESMPCSIKKDLQTIYKPFNQDLYRLLGREGSSSGELAFQQFSNDAKCHD